MMDAAIASYQVALTGSSSLTVQVRSRSSPFVPVGRQDTAIKRRITRRLAVLTVSSTCTLVCGACTQANGVEGKSMLKAWKVDPSLFSSTEQRQ
jgi:hypothetical protein